MKLTREELDNVQQAAKLIETDGVEAYHATSARFGPGVALLLLVAHLRRSFGAGESYPVDPEIDARVERVLQDERIVEIVE